MGLLLARAVAGVVAGVIVFFATIHSAMDVWMPLLAASIVASAGVAALNAAVRTSHYKAWAARRAGRPRGAVPYVFTQTALGLPVVAAAGCLAWAATYVTLVAG